MPEKSALDFAKDILASQPFSVLLGTDISTFGDGEAVVSMPLRADYQQQHGFAHGGAVGYLADVAMAFAGGSVLGDSVTVEYKVNFLRPAKGDRLIGRAKVVGSGRTQAVVSCEIYSAESGPDGDTEKLCAAAQGTFRKV